MSSAKGGTSARATVTLNPNHRPQTVETVHQVIHAILGKAGCQTCGRLAFLDIQFQGDPGPELQGAGVISMSTEGM